MTEYYETLRFLHVACVVITIVFFCIRVYWMQKNSSNLQMRWVKVTPHLVDSTLLGTAIGLVLMTGQYPFVHSWLTVKVAMLVVYIVLGIIALRRRSIFAGIAAIITFGFMVSVALTKQPAGILAGIP